MVWFTVLGVLIFIAIYLQTTREQQEEEEEHKRKQTSMLSSLPLPSVADISLEQARIMVDDLIAKGEKLFAGPVDMATPLPEELGPVTREFFSRYGTLTTEWGGFLLSASEIRESECVHGFLSIGHWDDWDLVQRPGFDEVYVVDGGETSDAEMDDRFPSVYHLALDEGLI